MKKIFLLLTVVVSVRSFAQDQTALRKKNFNLSDDVALQGYDPVAYFIQNKAVKGNKDISVLQEGALYYFSSVADKEAFKSNPGKYEPQYGGWCAYAMGKEGSKIGIDPETFKIIDGKLFVFYNQLFNNTLKSWNRDESNLHKKADANWQKIFHP